MTPPLPISPTFPLLPVPLPIGPPPMLPPTLPPNDDPPKLEGPAVDTTADDEDDEGTEMDVGIPLPTTPSELPKPRLRPPSEGNSDGSNVCNTPFSVELSLSSFMKLDPEGG